LVGTSSGGVCISTDNGANWSSINSELTNMAVQALAVSGSFLFAGTAGSGVFRKDNNDTNWIAVNSGLTNMNILSFVVSGAYLFAGTAGGAFRSSDSGQHWIQVCSGLTNTDIHSFVVSGSNLYIGTDGGGVFLSSDNGATWLSANSGLTFMQANAFAVSQTDIFVGTNGGVWRRPLSEMGVSTVKTKISGPINFHLGEIYPNPFNSNTSFQFFMPQAGKIALHILDCKGALVSTLIDGFLTAGPHTASWKAGQFATGIYICNFQAGSFCQDRRLLLIK